METFKWYECTKCHKQGYTNGIPNPEFNGGCYPDGPRGNHNWGYLDEWETDTNEYPESEYDITQ